jgi:hypothetical protein
MSERIKKYNNMINKLLYMNDNKINSIINNQNKSTMNLKWGEVGIIEINNTKIFYKKIPLAKLFYDSGMTTSNLYNLPAYYNYGYGSAGINPWRELITHINLSNYVLQGEIDNFPLLYNWRIIKDNTKNFNSGLSDKLMNTYGNNVNIKKYLEDRYNCKYKILMLIEFIPFVLYKYINKKPSYLKNYEVESKKILDFLSSKKILHMDAHEGNYLVDKKGKLYLTDFGLVLDKKFDLDKDEIKFMNENKKLAYYYFYESIYSIYKHNAGKMFDDELNKKMGKIEYAKMFIKSIDFPISYINHIKLNKNKIIKVIKLKNNFINTVDKKKVFL